MLAWLWKSKEWVFSGIGVPIVIGIFMLFRNLVWRKSAQSQLRLAPDVPSLTDESIHNFGTVVDQQRRESKPSGNDIARAVNNAPTFQQSQVGANYVGLIVSWPIIFLDLMLLDGQRCEVRLAYGTETWGAKIEVAIDIDHYPRLKSAHGAFDQIMRGEKLNLIHGWIKGKIVRCGCGGMEIEPTRLEFFD